MAIFYLAAQVIGRSAGRSSVAAAAYRAGERIRDERTGQMYDFSHRRGLFITEIIAPDGSPEWATVRSRLWNEVEATEKRCNSQLAKEVLVALPKELRHDQQLVLVREFVKEQFVSLGMVADIALHLGDTNNPHAHILLTTRVMQADGFGAKIRANSKTEWQNRGMNEMERWREQWALHANRALERAGERDRIDHRSYERQGKDLIAQVHLGPNAHALERKGVQTDKGEHNRTVQERNHQVIELQKAREELQRARAEKMVMTRYAARVRSGWTPVTARALADVELEHGGTALDRDQLNDLRVRTEKRLLFVKQERQRIVKDGDRLKAASMILESKNRSDEKLRRLERPLSMMKRWFSQQAKDEYARTQDHVKETHDQLRRLGVNDRADFEVQYGRWEAEKKQLPMLQQDEQRLTQTLSRTEQALEGFRLLEQKRHRTMTLNRSREMERDR